MHSTVHGTVSVDCESFTLVDMWTTVNNAEMRGMHF